MQGTRSGSNATANKHAQRKRIIPYKAEIGATEETRRRHDCAADEPRFGTGADCRASADLPCQPDEGTDPSHTHNAARSLVVAATSEPSPPSKLITGCEPNRDTPQLNPWLTTSGGDMQMRNHAVTAGSQSCGLGRRCFRCASSALATASHALRRRIAAPAISLALSPSASPSSHALAHATEHKSQRSPDQRHQQPRHGSAEAREQAPEQRCRDIPEFQQEADAAAPASEVVQFLANGTETSLCVHDK